MAPQSQIRSAAGRAATRGGVAVAVSAGLGALPSSPMRQIGRARAALLPWTGLPPSAGAPELSGREPGKAADGDSAELVSRCLLSEASQVPVLPWVCADPLGLVCRDSRSCFRIGYCIPEGWSSEDRRRSSGERLLVSHAGPACRTAPSQQQDLAEYAAALCCAACAPRRAFHSPESIWPHAYPALAAPHSGGLALCHWVGAGRRLSQGGDSRG